MRAILALSLLSLAGAAVAAEPIQPDASVARGRVLVERNCGMCHAVGRAGSSPNPAAPAFRDLNRRYDPDALAEALAEGIITRHPAMPEFVFPPEQVNDIIRYLKSIQTRDRASAEPPPAE